jgi:hypothetical protein
MKPINRCWIVRDRHGFLLALYVSGGPVACTVHGIYERAVSRTRLPQTICIGTI